MKILQIILISETKDKEDSKVELTLTEIDTKKKYKVKSMKNLINNINTIGRYSIDCNIANNAKKDKNVNVFKSNDDLPFIKVKENSNDRYSMFTINEEGKTPRHQNVSYNKKNNKPVLKELQHVRTSGKRYNSIQTHVNNSSFASTAEKEKEKEEEPKKKSKFFKTSNKNIETTNFDERPRKKILTSTKLPLITNLDEKIDMNEIGNLRKVNAHKTKKHYKLKINNNLDLKIKLPEDESKKPKSTKNALEVL
jgi:hypothetical protein